jgi:hypothetical protein
VPNRADGLRIWDSFHPSHCIWDHICFSDSALILKLWIFSSRRKNYQYREMNLDWNHQGRRNAEALEGKNWGRSWKVWRECRPVAPPFSWHYMNEWCNISIRQQSYVQARSNMYPVCRSDFKPAAGTTRADSRPRGDCIKLHLINRQ